MAPETAQAFAIPDKDAIHAALEEGRTRTWLLASGLRDRDLAEPAAEYLSPPAWDLGHMANFEELWLVQELLECGEMRPGYNDTYDAIQHPRPERPTLDLLDRDGVRRYMDEVRGRALAVLDGQVFTDACPRLLEDGFVYWLLVLHEHQHQETLLQSIQMRGPDRYEVPAARLLPPPRPGAQRAALPMHPGAEHATPDTGSPGAPEGSDEAWIRIPAGRFTMGVPHGAGVYDNEAPPHERTTGAYDIATFPVTCGQYLPYVEGGGYEDRRLWSPRGREWLDATDHHAPLYWENDGDTWWRRGLRGRHRVRDVADEILCHVTWFEAEAYARWRGARLPTEAEWEKAARWDPDTGDVAGRNPWGDGLADTRWANIDQLGWGPGRVGAYPDGASPSGVEHMVGDVWEWCSDGWHPYPGFEAFPYRAYSEVFFGGDYHVLRGGSWASRAGCATATFRNWDHPYRRQIFSGIRLAR